MNNLIALSSSGPHHISITSTCTYHGCLPHGGVVMQVVDLDVDHRAHGQRDAVYDQLLGQLPLNEGHRAVETHALLDTHGQVLQLGDVIPV